MNCQILRTLYVKANGTIPCEDNAGEWVTLGNVSLDPDWSIAHVLDGQGYDQLRGAFARGEFPWPKVCQRCALIRPHQQMDDQISQKRIEKLQIETSLTCTLRCPCCSFQGQLKLRHKPFVMDIKIFRRLLESLIAEKYQIGFIEYCGQGEPLTHPQFAEFVKTAREIYPATPQRLVTNANYDYDEKIRGEFIDEIYVSCDGIFQENYEKYRRGGSVAKALKFMRDAGALMQARRPLVVWKYILFEHNDSPEEIVAAQSFALAANVGMLMFVLTQTDFRSKIYTSNTHHHILLLAPNARLFKTPDFQREAGHDRPERTVTLSLSEGAGNTGTKRYVDHMGVFPGLLTVQGWALAGDPEDRVESIAATGDGQPLGLARLGVLRLDVHRQIHGANTAHAGFILASRWPDDKSHPERIGLKITTQKGVVERSTWDVHSSADLRWQRAMSLFHRRGSGLPSPRASRGR